MLRISATYLSRFLNLFRPSPIAAPPMSDFQQVEPSGVDVGQVRELIGRVSVLTSTVAQDVGQHNVSVQAISSELTAVAENDSTAVAAIVCKLLVANQELQGRLERAEGTLQSHSQQLRDAVQAGRTDGLTGLLNRRALDEELTRCLADFRAGGAPPQLLMLDVDRFKQLNDTFGHVAGDRALVHVADTLREQSTTDIIGRYGGEEFAVAFCGANAEAAREMAEGLRLAIGSRPVVSDERQMQVTASAGLAAALPDDTISDWFKRADEALYAAKKAGRNCGFEIGAGGPVRLTLPTDDEIAAEPAIGEHPAARTVAESAAELAAEAFDDTTFAPSIARRIAEWRRGGATLTVVLARLDAIGGDIAEPDAQAQRLSVRLALQLARACVREMDLVTRWQGSGLAFLLPGTSASEAKLFARRLTTAFDSANSTMTNTPLSSICMGIAEGIEGNDAKRVLERAWLALETARISGPASVCIHDGVKTVVAKPPAAARCS